MVPNLSGAIGFDGFAEPVVGRFRSGSGAATPADSLPTISADLKVTRVNLSWRRWPVQTAYIYHIDGASLFSVPPFVRALVIQLSPPSLLLSRLL